MFMNHLGFSQVLPQPTVITNPTTGSTLTDPANGSFLTDPGYTIPLRSAAMNNGNFTGTMGIGSTANKFFFRYPHILGADMRTLTIAPNNWYSAQGGSGYENSAGEFSYDTVSLELPNGNIIPLTYGGFRSKYMPKGCTDQVFDVMPVIAYGYPGYIPRGSIVWVKGVGSVTPGESIPIRGDSLTSDMTGCQIGSFNSAVTTISSTDIAGAFTFTGTTPGTTGQVHFPILVGHPVSDGKSFLLVGDSRMAGFADNNIIGPRGTGMYARALNDGPAAGYANPYPAIKMAQGGNTSGAYRGGNSLWKSYIKYCTIAFDEVGVNEVSGGNLYYYGLAMQEIWAAYRAGGIKQIWRMGLLTECNSSNSFINKAGQTVANADFNTGGCKFQYEAWFQSQLAAAVIDKFIPFTELLDADTRYWKTNSVTQNLMTVDGIHQAETTTGSVGQSTGAAVLRAIIAAS